jgi:hypothetical protein
MTLLPGTERNRRRCVTLLVHETLACVERLYGCGMGACQLIAIAGANS